MGYFNKYTQKSVPIKVIRCSYNALFLLLAKCWWRIKECRIGPFYQAPLLMSDNQHPRPDIWKVAIDRIQRGRRTLDLLWRISHICLLLLLNCVQICFNVIRLLRAADLIWVCLNTDDIKEIHSFVMATLALLDRNRQPMFPHVQWKPIKSPFEEHSLSAVSIKVLKSQKGTKSQFYRWSGCYRSLFKLRVRTQRNSWIRRDCLNSHLEGLPGDMHTW